MNTKLKNKSSMLTDEEIEQYCYSVEKLLIDISKRSNSKKSKKVNSTEEKHFSLEDEKQVLSRG